MLNIRIRHIRYICFVSCRTACLPKEPLVLDVGSCYNPFKEMTEFKVIGVDLHPATEVGIARITYILFKIPGIKCVSDSLMPVFKLSIYLANSIYLRYGVEPELLGHFSLPCCKWRIYWIVLGVDNLIPPKPWPSVVKLLDQGIDLLLMKLKIWIWVKKTQVGRKKTHKTNELWETIVFICVHISNVLLISKSYSIVEALLVFKIQNEILAKQCNSSPVLLSVNIFLSPEPQVQL